MRISLMVGFLVSVSFAMPAVAQGLKIDPFPKAKVVATQDIRGLETRDFTQEALKQLNAGRMDSMDSGALEIVVDQVEEPVQEIIVSPQVDDGILRLDPIEGFSDEKAIVKTMPQEAASPVLPLPDEVAEPVIEPISEHARAAELAKQRFISNNPELASGRVPPAKMEKSMDKEPMAQEVVAALPFVPSETLLEEPPMTKRALPGKTVAQYNGVPVVVLGDDAELAALPDLEVAAVSAEPVVQDVWRAGQGESLRAALDQWSASQGVSFIWDSPTDFAVLQDFSSNASFEEGVAAVLDQHISQPVRPVAKLFSDPVTGFRSLTVKAQRF